MKKAFASLMTILSCICIFGQNEVKNPNSYLSNEVYKNIAAYNIRYCSYNFNGINLKKTFYSNSDFFYNYFLADSGFKMKMNITKLDTSYPDPRFHLYKITIEGFNFYQEKGDYSTSSLGPITTKLYLLALNESNGEIKFISGQYFKSAISQDFRVNLKAPQSLIPYIQMRSYLVSPTNIMYVKKRHGELVYSAYSELYKKPIKIVLSKKDLEEIKISVSMKDQSELASN